MRFILMFLIVFVANAANAVEAPRTVLAFYNDNGDELRFNPLHLLAEMPFNHLGLKFEYHNIADPLPLDAATDPSVAGVITWFDNFCVLLRRDGQSQLVYKHAISTIMPSQPINLYDGDD